MFFLLLVMNWFFVLTVETSLIDKDGKVFMSLKGNILGTLVLRPDMIFFSFFVGVFVCKKLECFLFFL